MTASVDRIGDPGEAAVNRAGDLNVHSGGVVFSRVKFLVPGPRSPEGAVGLVLNISGWFGQLVGDGPGVAGQAGRGCVDLVDEQGQGAGDAGRVGLLEFDGDRAAGCR